MTMSHDHVRVALGAGLGAVTASGARKSDCGRAGPTKLITFSAFLDFALAMVVAV